MSEDFHCWRKKLQIRRGVDAGLKWEVLGWFYVYEYCIWICVQTQRSKYGGVCIHELAYTHIILALSAEARGATTPVVMSTFRAHILVSKHYSSVKTQGSWGRSQGWGWKSTRWAWKIRKCFKTMAMSLKNTGGAPSDQSRNELNDKINDDSIGLEPTKSNQYPWVYNV